MQRIKRIMGVMLITTLIIIIFPDCEKPFGKNRNLPMDQISFRDIPGVTKDEIKAIEALQAKHEYFIYGMTLSSEAFMKENNEIGGFSGLFCQWLTHLFGIPFKPVNYGFMNLCEALQNGDAHFTGCITPNEERKKTCFMTDAIAEHSIKYFRLANSRSFAAIQASRPLRFGLPKGVISADYDLSAFKPGTFEILFVDHHDKIYDLLKKGKIDAFIYHNTMGAVFDGHNDIVVEDFSPAVYYPVSMTTRNPELAPIISIMQKALKSGAYPYIEELYERGEIEYKKHKLFMQFTKEELAYINNTPVVLFAAEHDAYPHEFYNTREKKWQGITFDLVSEISKITGLRFELANDQYAEWDDLVKMLADGKVSILADMIRTTEREKFFIWTETNVLMDNYAILSKSEFRNIDVDDIMYISVGLVKNLAIAELFQTWFPYHPNVVMYDNVDYLINALEQDEVNAIMLNRNKLLAMSNYYDKPWFKADIIFDPPIYSGFTLKKNNVILRSIMDKALQLVDIKTITAHWKNKTYDYRAKLAEMRRPWLIGTTVLISCILALLSILLIRSRSTEKRLEKLIKERTHDLEIQSSTLQTIVDSIPGIVFCKDLNLNYTLTNKFTTDYFGLDKNRIIGKHNEEGLKVPDETIKLIHDIDQRVISENQKIMLEIQIPTFDGSEQRLFEVIKAPLIQDGVTAGIVGVAYDITQRKAMEEAAQAASRSKSAFLANMSHEMRTPMNVVVGLTDLMLEEDDPTAHLKSNLKKISTAGNTLLGLINDVLDISKIEAGKLELMPAQYDVPSLLNDIITLNMIRIEEKPITFRLDIREDLPCSLLGDDLRVKQIINNLLSNAFKYTLKGTVTLGISCEQENSENVRLSVYVSDTGIGIRDEDLKKLFTTYGQVDTRANRKIEGTGLGLSITKMLVDHMHGEIFVESEYGKGSTFSFYIRQGFVSDKTIGSETAENLRGFRYQDSRKRAHATLVRPDLSYASVLVVDDMQTNLDVAEGMLRKYKMHVDCVSSGQAAIALIEKGEPVYDAIFMDHMMPEMDGVEATAKIRAIGTKYAMTIPIIALTANAIAGNEQMFLNNNFQAFLSKPINIMNLDSVVQRWVRDKSKE